MGDATAVGFFTTLAVRARSEDEAVEAVRSMIVEQGGCTSHLG